jgi:hypothetical protein
VGLEDERDSVFQYQGPVLHSSLISQKQQCAQRAARMHGTVLTCREEESEVGMMYVTCFLYDSWTVPAPLTYNGLRRMQSKALLSSL